LAVATLLTACITLADTSGFSAQATQIIKLGPANTASLHHIDMVYDSRMQWKNSFDANAKTGFTHRNCFACAAMFTSDHNPFEGLQTFFGFRFLDANMNAHCIARLKIRNVLAQLGFFNTV